jgi:PPOX class probable F420-dependent enzyme
MDRHTQSRLKKDLVVWLVTVGLDRRPQAVPVWFWWDGKSSFLIYSQPGRKVRDLQANPNVELHLNSDPVGDDVVRVSGTATVSKSQPAADKAAYLRKYSASIKDIGMTPAEFFGQYPFPIRVRRLRFQ